MAMDTVNGSKLCPKCGVTKPVIHFSMNKRRPDGLAHTCRDCHNKYQHDHPTPTTRNRRAVAGESRLRRLVASRDFVDPTFRIASRVAPDLGEAFCAGEIEKYDDDSDDNDDDDNAPPIPIYVAVTMSIPITVSDGLCFVDLGRGDDRTVRGTMMDAGTPTTPHEDDNT